MNGLQTQISDLNLLYPSYRRKMQVFFNAAKFSVPLVRLFVISSFSSFFVIFKFVNHWKKEDRVFKSFLSLVLEAT